MEGIAVLGFVVFYACLPSLFEDNSKQVTLLFHDLMWAKTSKIGNTGLHL